MKGLRQGYSSLGLSAGLRCGLTISSPVPGCSPHSARTAARAKLGALGVPDEEMIERNRKSVLRLMRHLAMLEER